MKTWLSVLLLISLSPLMGCEEETPNDPGLFNNEISKTWQGAYTGIGNFNAPSLSIVNRAVTVAVRIQDLGGNRVSVQLNMIPSDGYSPSLWMDVPVESIYTASHTQNDGGTRYNAEMRHTGNRLNASMSVVGAGETGSTWNVGLTAYDGDPPKGSGSIELP